MQIGTKVKVVINNTLVCTGIIVDYLISGIDGTTYDILSDGILHQEVCAAWVERV